MVSEAANRRGRAMILLACGFVAEARAAASSLVIGVPGGGDAGYLEAELERRAAEATAIISWGLTGALMEDLAVGDWVVGTGVAGALDAACDTTWIATALAVLPNARAGVFHADGLLADAPAKHALGRTGRLAVDMESHVAARIATRHGLPFAILRVVSDHVGDAVPPAVMASMGPGGRTDYAAIAASIARRPAQLPHFAAFARSALAAMRELRRGRALLGARLGAPDIRQRAADVV